MTGVQTCALPISSDSFRSGYNVENLIRRTALFGVISIGVAFVIVTGGIDLSIGSVICLVGCGLPWLLTVQHWSLPAALAMVTLVSVGIGLVHGLLVTRLRLQPFIVTLCGLLLYRPMAVQKRHQRVTTRLDHRRPLHIGVYRPRF